MTLTQQKRSGIIAGLVGAGVGGALGGPVGALVGAVAGYFGGEKLSAPKPLAFTTPAPMTTSVTPWEGMTGALNVKVGGQVVVNPPDGASYLAATPVGAGGIDAVLQPSPQAGVVVGTAKCPTVNILGAKAGNGQVQVNWQDAAQKTHAQTFNVRVDP